MLLAPVVELKPALAPTATLLDPVDTLSASRPTATLEMLLLLLRAKLPMPTFPPPATPFASAFSPTATLSLPLWFFSRALRPTATLQHPVLSACRLDLPTL